MRGGGGNGMRMMRLAVWIARGVTAVVLLVAGYATAGLAGGAIPRNAGWTAPGANAGGGVRVLVESNGVHTGLVLPKVAAGEDLRDLLRGDDLADPRHAALRYVAIGWGERAFYLETATWADVRPLTVLRAATGSDRVVLHVEHVRLPATREDTRAVLLRPAEYHRLVAFVRASFAPEATAARRWHARGYGGNDAFYAATGRYDAVRTCNAWTGDALAAAGVRVGLWTPFPVTVLGWFPA